MKNTCAKMIKLDKAETDAYEVWVCEDWTWYVLKKWQANDDKPFARWFCKVVTPMAPSGDLGDVYVSEIKAIAERVK